eukprot:2219758-Rhodomonas_salina.2
MFGCFNNTGDAVTLERRESEHVGRVVDGREEVVPDLVLLLHVVVPRIRPVPCQRQRASALRCSTPSRSRCRAEGLGSRASGAGLRGLRVSSLGSKPCEHSAPQADRFGFGLQGSELSKTERQGLELLRVVD